MSRPKRSAPALSSRDPFEKFQFFFFFSENGFSATCSRTIAPIRIERVLRRCRTDKNEKAKTFQSAPNYRLVVFTYSFLKIYGSFDAFVYAVGTDLEHFRAIYRVMKFRSFSIFPVVVWLIVGLESLNFDSMETTYFSSCSYTVILLVFVVMCVYGKNSFKNVSNLLKFHTSPIRITNEY